MQRTVECSLHQVNLKSQHETSFRTKSRLMSRKPSPPPVAPKKPKADSRVLRTRNILGDALIELLREKRFATITVQQVLDRAGVGRSTFYSHYRDKDDLFLSDVEDFLEMMSTLLLRSNENSVRIVPLHEFLSHVAGNRDLWKALVAAGKGGDFLEMAEGHFARAIAKRLASLPASKTIPASRRTPMSHALAGSMLSLMFWWLDHSSSASPEEVDRAYHQLAWSGIGADSQPASKR
jgi:AcrR family transcriptional regulator